MEKLFDRPVLCRFCGGVDVGVGVDVDGGNELEFFFLNGLILQCTDLTFQIKVVFCHQLHRSIMETRYVTLRYCGDCKYLDLICCFCFGDIKEGIGNSRWSMVDSRW